MIESSVAVHGSAPCARLPTTTMPCVHRLGRRSAVMAPTLTAQPSGNDAETEGR